MKKFTLISAAAVVALGAAAQGYNVDPATSIVLASGEKYIVDYITLSDAAIAEFTNAGCTVNYVGPDSNAGRNLWYWSETFLAGDESMPRVNFDEGGYVSLEVSNVGWSGAGFAIDEPGVDLSHFSDNTRFHIGYMSPTNNAPASVALIILDNSDGGSIPAKVAIGSAFEDNGNIFTSVGAAMTDEWNGIDISFSDLKKFYPSFSPANLSAWQGNILSVLAGGIQGKTVAFDAIYFYTPEGENHISEISADAADAVVYYNLAGQLVNSANMPAGIYVAKSGNKAQKVLVK